MTKLKLSIHPVYFGIMLYYIIVGRGGMFFSFLIAVLLHELAHWFCSAYHGYSMGKITLMPYGALLGSNGDMPRQVIWKVAIVGPIFSLLMALLTLSAWWIMPTLYQFTYHFFRANIVIAIFNILPCYPLDGGRVLMSLPVKNRLRLVWWLRASGILCSVAFIVAGLISIAFTFNITLIFNGVFLFLSATLGGAEETYMHVASSPLFSKAYGEGVQNLEVTISEEASMLRVLRLIKPNRLIILRVIDSNGGIVATYNEATLAKIIKINSLNTKIREAKLQ